MLCVTMFSTRHLGRRLKLNALASYSSKADQFDPRTPEITKLIVPWRYRKGEKRLLKKFWSFMNMSDVHKFLVSPIDFRKDKVNSFLLKKRYEQELYEQNYDAERMEALGSDLSVGHLLLEIGAAVKYKGKPWLKYNILDRDFPSIPEEFQEGWTVEAVDLSDTFIRFEGLQNFRGLNSLHTLIARKCPHLDDWCLDQICSELLCLEVIDLTGCQKVSPRGLLALTRLPNLRSLNLSEIPAFETAAGRLLCLLLQEVNPKINILGVTYPDISTEREENTSSSA